MRSKFHAVCFDCDSTLSRIEGIDELALRVDCLDEIAALTNAAMDGGVALSDIYAKRLDRVRPGRADLIWLGQRYIDETVVGARQTIAALQESGAVVYIVSGGLLQAIVPLAETLGIVASQVHAVDVRFDSSGLYSGFDASSPLTRNDGKAVICRAIAEQHDSVAMVGDGVTDLASKDAGAYVVGFGGVVARAVMQQGADHFTSNPSLASTLDALLVDEK